MLALPGQTSPAVSILLRLCHVSLGVYRDGHIVLYRILIGFFIIAFFSCFCLSLVGS